MAGRKLIERLKEVKIECDALPYWMKKLMGIESRSGKERRVLVKDILAHGGHRRKGVPWILLSDNNRSGKDRRVG